MSIRLKEFQSLVANCAANLTSKHTCTALKFLSECDKILCSQSSLCNINKDAGMANEPFDTGRKN